MKTNQFRTNKNSVLLFSIALLFFPFITKAQLNVDAGGNVGVNISAPSAKLEVLTANSAATNLATKFTNPNTNQAGAQILIGPYSDNYMSSISATGYPYSTYATNLWLRPRKSDASLGNGIYIAPTDNVGIGTTSPDAKLDVVSSTAASITVRGKSTATSGTSYGGWFEARGTSSGTNAAIYAYAGGGTVNYNCYLANLSASANNWSIYSAAPAKSYFAGDVGIGTATPGLKLHVVSNANTFRLQGTDHTFMEFYPDGAATRKAYFGFAAGADNNLTIANEISGAHIILLPTGAGNVGVGTSTPDYKLEVEGSFNVNGLAYCSSGAWFSSDQQFKTNIDSISNALPLIDQLKPRSFYFDTTNVYGMNFSSQKQYGLIAQDVEQILPELVTSTTKSAGIDSLGNVIHPAVTYKSLNYNAFTAIMLQGIKEQGGKIDNLSEDINTEKEKTNNQDSIIASLQTQMNALASLINSCCNNHHDNGHHNGYREANSNQTNIELNDAQTIVLEQNVPNPFAEQTTIAYNLPDNTLKAQILFYNAQGKLIQSTELTQKGKGTLNVFASDLSSGIYTYTLVVDGEIIETKKMVKQ